jgi:hypothetical protein
LGTAVAEEQARCGPAAAPGSASTVKGRFASALLTLVSSPKPSTHGIPRMSYLAFI